MTKSYLIAGIVNALVAGWWWNQYLQDDSHTVPMPISPTVGAVIVLAIAVMNAMWDRKKGE